MIEPDGSREANGDNLAAMHSAKVRITGKVITTKMSEISYQALEAGLLNGLDKDGAEEKSLN